MDKLKLEFNGEEELNQYKKEFLLLGLTNRVNELKQFLNDFGVLDKKRIEDMGIFDKIEEIFGVRK